MYDNQFFELHLWDVQTGTIAHKFIGHNETIYQADISPDGRYAISLSNDGTIRLWDIATGEEIRQMRTDNGVPLSVDFAPDSRTVLVGLSSRLVERWDVETGTLIQVLSGHEAAVNWTQVSYDGRLAITTSLGSGEMILWDLQTGLELRRLGGLGGIFTPDGRLITATIEDKIVVNQMFSTNDEIVAWAHQNRHIREFTCLERERYLIEPYCDPTESAQ